MLKYLNTEFTEGTHKGHKENNSESSVKLLIICHLAEPQDSVISVVTKHTTR